MYRKLSSRVDNEMEEKEATDRLLSVETSSSTISVPSQTTIDNSSKLKLNLPTFSGNILPWWDF